ncbi:MAG: ceramide glucosyltransferase [Alphaproteobacteria bacterium]
MITWSIAVRFLENVALIFVCAALIMHVVTTLLAMRRCRAIRVDQDIPMTAPPVSIVRPVRGLDQYDMVTLGSSFSLDYPDYELIFCCADATDPAVSAIRELMEANPESKAQLLIGDDGATANPKLNNLSKGWNAAQYDWIVIADSNVLMPPDYLTRLLTSWRPDTGLVCSPPIGCKPEGFWAELECGFLNTYQARWQYAADSIGLGFAQGKTMLWRSSDLEVLGGIGVLSAEAAEDAAATKVVRAQRLRVRLVDRPFEQPLGMRSARQVWQRQLRWAKLRRASFPAYFVPEILTGILLPLMAAAFAADAFGLDKAVLVILLCLFWYGAEGVLATASGWHCSWWSPLAWMARDVVLPFLWLAAWLGNSFTWRGNSMSVSPAHSGRLIATAPRPST